MNNIYPLLKNLFLVILTLSSFTAIADEAKTTAEETAMTTLVCPDDVWLDCDAEIWWLEQYGWAQYHDNYGWHDAGNPTTNYNLGSCNTGTITRTWSIEDEYWNWQTCTQTIYVGGGNNGFSEYNINWPEDIILTGCNPNTHPDYLPYGQDRPTWTYVDCSMVGVTYTDHLYTINAGCTAILREWRIVDWCQEGTDWYGNPTGEWKYTQEIKMMNNEIPYVHCPSDISASSDNCWDAYVNVPSLYVPPSSCGGDFTITNNSPYAYNSGANISGVYPIGWTTVKYSIKYGCGSIKTCTVKIHVTNDQGPTPYCYGSLTLVLAGTDTDGDGVNDKGRAELWAKDIDKGSFVNCGTNNYLRFSFSSNVYDDVKIFTCDEVGINYVDMWVTDASGNQSYCTVIINIQNNGANIIDCQPDDTGGGSGGGNGGSGGGNGGSGGGNGGSGGGDGGSGSDSTRLYDISGHVYTTFEDPVEGVRLDLANGVSDTVFNITYLDTTEVITLDSFINGSGSVIYTLEIDTFYTTVTDTVVNDLLLTQYSNEWGRYFFDSVGVNSEIYSVTATLDSTFDSSAYSNGVNSADLQMLMDYLLGDKQFKGNAELLAADIDGDGDVDFNDLKLLYRYIVGEIEELPTQAFTVVSNDVLALSNDIFNEENINVSIRTIQGAPVSNAHFTLIQLGDIVSPNSSNLVALNDNEGAIHKIAVVESINELKIEMRKELASVINAYPNPFTRQFTVEYNTTNVGEDVVLELYDITGKLIISNTVENKAELNTIEVNINDQRSGTYIYRVIDGDKVLSGRILKI